MAIHCRLAWEGAKPLNKSVTEIPSLDGIRGFCSLFVVLVHADAYFGAFWGGGALLAHTPNGGRHLEIVVDAFFILSGLVMNHVYGRQLSAGQNAAVAKFYVARVARIFPLYFVVLIATMLIAPHSFSFVPTGFHFSIEYLVQQIFFLGFLTNMQVLVTWNTPSWSVQVEMLVYLFFPMIALIIARLQKRWWVLLGLLLCVFTLFMIGRSGDLSFEVGRRAFIRGFSGFTAGALLYETLRYGWIDRYRWAVFTVAFASLIGFVTCWQDPLLVVAQACFLLLLMDKRSLLFSVLNASWSRWLGTISYSTYLWHRPLEFVMAALIMHCGIHFAIGPVPAAVICIVLSFPITVLVAHWSFNFIERPGKALVLSSYKTLAPRVSPAKST
jgi:peptidoglycan/LPS O-acetylase OafA/YrhL